jgi:hypothetical protein
MKINLTVFETLNDDGRSDIQTRRHGKVNRLILENFTCQHAKSMSNDTCQTTKCSLSTRMVLNSYSLLIEEKTEQKFLIQMCLRNFVIWFYICER